MTRASKTVSPSVPPLTIARPVLEERLDESLTRRITTVVAGAGYGKSTLLAQWGARSGCAWYTIDRTDGALSSLASGLAIALRRRVPAIPDYLTEVTSRQGAEDPGRASALTVHLAEALQAVLDDDLAFVLDDAQELDPGSPSSRLIEGICRHAPERLHIVLCSRTEIPFPIERLRGRGQVLELDPTLLAFSREETSGFARSVLGAEGPELVGPIHDMTGGWPAAVRLALEALRTAEQGRRAEVLERLSRPEGPIFPYLAGEVFRRELPAVRELLRRAAPFDRFTGDLCEYLGVPDAGGTLASLLRRGLFVQPQGGAEGWFVLHALIREFVLRSWPMEEREHEALHRRAAEWFEGNGYLVEALHSLAAVLDPAGVARLLAERGTEILARGAVDFVLELGESVPPELRSERLEAILGEAYTVRGEPSRAEQCFRRAARGAGDLPPGLAWRIGLMHHERGEHVRALQMFDRGRIDGSQPADEAVLLAAIGTTHLLTGDPATAQTFTTRALPIAEASGDERALAAVHAALMMEVSRRDPHSADHHYHRAIEGAEAAGDVLLAIRLRTNRASHLDDRGEYHEALEELEIAIRQAELSGYTERLALALNNRGFTRFHLGRLEEAIGDLQRAKALYEGAGSIRVAWPLMHLGAVYRERGDVALARAVLEEALPLAQRMEDVQGMIGAQANLARILAHDEPEEASRLAERALQVGRLWSGLIDALIAAGWVAHSVGQPEKAAALAQEAAREARAEQNRPGLAESLELAAMATSVSAQAIDLLEEAASIWRELQSPMGEARCELALARLSSGPASHGRVKRAERGLRLLGVRFRAAAGAAGLLAALPREEHPPVTIRVMGGFRVLRQGKPATASEWRSKKARDLVKILVSRRGRPLPREALMEALWPDEEPGPLARRLAVALATTRAVLDPLRQFPNDHFIAAEGSVLWIDLEHVSVDVEEFLAEAAAGMSLLRGRSSENARDVLEAAEARYTGDYLEEDLYEDWAAPLREEARSAYITVVRALARLGHESGDSQAAVDYRLRILERDPYDEEAHLGLVATLSGIGRHGEARRFYRQYVARMEELGVEPAPMPPPLESPPRSASDLSASPAIFAPTG